MRILYLNPCGQMGGAETSLRDLLASLRTAKPDWELWLALGEDGPLADSVRELGVRVIVEPFPAALARLGDAGRRPFALVWSGLKAMAGTVLYVRRLARIQQTIQPDLIHTNGLKMHVLGLWAGAHSTPVIWHIRDYIGSRSVMKVCLRLHARFCAAAIANSESVSRDLQSVCGPKLKIDCIYNAVDLARYTPDGNKVDLDALSGLSPAAAGTVRIGLIATLARWKGHAVFLKALSRLSHDLPCRAYVIGGPIYQTEKSQHTLQELETLANGLGLGGKVGFTGFVQDSGGAIRALDIVVHASTEPEPFGRVIAEAMACGRPVISSACGGAQELVTEGYNALTHTPGDPVTLAASMERLACDPQMRLRMGCAGRATAERRFALGRLAAELTPIYRRAITRATPGIPVHSGALR